MFWVVPASRVAWLPPLPYFLTVGLPANLLGTSSQAPRLAMSLNVAKFYLGQVNLEPMQPAVLPY